MTGTQVAVGVSGLHRLAGAGPGASVRLARAVEAIGADHVVVGDHLLGTADAEGYPWPGGYAYPPDEPWPEPLTELAVIAGATEHIGLLTAVLVAALRPAPVLAKAAATLDVRSGGRLQLGVGAGWLRAEFDACGVPYEGRGRAMEDTVRACQALWAGGPSSHVSPTVRFDAVWSSPTPERPGGIPVWFGGPPGERVARRVAEMGRGWLCGGGAHRAADPAAYVREGMHLLRRAFETHDRDPACAEAMVTLATGPDPSARLRATAPLVATGATIVAVPLAGLADDVDTAMDVLTWLLPHIKELP